MTHEYFSDREYGPRPQNSEEINENAWGGLKAAVENCVEDGSFAKAFPRQCEDGGGVHATDERRFSDSLKSHTPKIEWPLRNNDDSLDTRAVLDMLEFCHERVAAPEQIGRYHDYFGHTHLQFDKPRGQAEFREEVNTIFARNGIAFELTESGRIERTLPPVLGDLVRDTTFQTEDDGLDEYLDKAKTKFLNPDPAMHREARESLWDAWERLKSIEYPGDKKKSINALLDRAAADLFRKHLDTEARELTCIGNKFRIRHSETDKKPLDEPHHVDYMFYRLFAMIHMLLVASGKDVGGA